jgi:hypothetical protein
MLAPIIPHDDVASGVASAGGFFFQSGEKTVKLRRAAWRFETSAGDASARDRRTTQHRLGRVADDRCDKCQSWLYVTPRQRPESLRCACNAVSLNLLPKPK